LYDLQKGTSYPLPNEYYNFLHLTQTMELDKVLDLNTNLKFTFLRFIEYLIESKIGFLAEDIELFSNSKQAIYETPYQIENVIIEIENLYVIDYFKLLEKLAELDVPDYQIRILSPSIQIDEVSCLLNILKKTSAKAVELFYPSFEDIKVDKLFQLIKSNKRLSRIFLYDHGYDEIKSNKDLEIDNRLISIKKDIRLDSSEEIAISNFVADFHIYNEAMSFNVGLNKKLTIDKSGYISNSISSETIIKFSPNIEWKKILNNKTLRKYWEVTNDMIEKCKDCQFRYMCISTSELVLEYDVYKKRELCYFDPYTNL